MSVTGMMGIGGVSYLRWGNLLLGVREAAEELRADRGELVSFACDVVLVGVDLFQLGQGLSFRELRVRHHRERNDRAWRVTHAGGIQPLVELRAQTQRHLADGGKLPVVVSAPDLAHDTLGVR